MLFINISRVWMMGAKVLCGDTSDVMAGDFGFGLQPARDAI